MKKNKVIYSCITGDYDDVPNYLYYAPDWKYILFTDNYKLLAHKKINNWEIRPLNFSEMDNVKNARWHKINAHILFPEYDYSVWIDANISIQNRNPVLLFEDLIKKNTLVAVPNHPVRNCIYDEAKEIIRLEIDYSKIVNKEIKFLERENYPVKNGLSETNILFRQHNKIIGSLDLWWFMIKKYSKRDQISFNYTMWKTKTPITSVYSKNGVGIHHCISDFKFEHSQNHNQDKIIYKKYSKWLGFRKEKLPSGRRHIYLFGIKVWSYKKKKISEYDRLYAQRFNPDYSDANKRKVIDYQFLSSNGYAMDWNNPQTFNQKLQWLKLYNEDPLITTCAAKDTAKEYVSKVLGKEYIIPNIATYNSADEIDFDKLPNAFVLKVNWGSGQNIIVRDKNTADIFVIKEQLRQWMNPHSNHYYFSFEFSYKNISPKIVCEPYIGDLTQNLTCYKVFNFCGKPYLIQTVFDDKTSYETINYYDLNWNKLDLRQNFPNNDKDIPAPVSLKKLISCSEKLAKPFPCFVRTDFFEVAGKVLFSEFTFYSDNGTAAFHPQQWDEKLGEMIDLNKVKKG